MISEYQSKFIILRHGSYDVFIISGPSGWISSRCLSCKCVLIL